MNISELLMSHAAALALSASRISGFVVTSPFPGEHVTGTPRIALVASIAFFLVSGTDLAKGPMALDFSLLPKTVGELACGGAIGFAFRLVVTCVDMLGGLSAQASGLAAGSVLNPTMASPDTALGRITTLFGLLLAMTVGAHRVALAYVLASFRVLPIGEGPSFASAAPMLAVLLGRALEMGVRLALPVIGASLLLQIGLAIISRAAPALQLFSIGFSVLALAGLGVYGASWPSIASSLLDELGRLPEILDALLGAMSA